MAMYEPALVRYRKFERRRNDGTIRPWPTMQKAPTPVESKPGYELISKQAYQDSAITPMEWLSQLAGGSGFKEPCAGRSTRTDRMTTLDVAAALGCVSDPLKQHLAHALSTMSVAEWSKVQPLAWPLLIEQLLASHKTRSMVAGRKRLRARILLHDVFFDRALRRTPRFAADMAWKFDMPERDYRQLYHAVSAFLDTYAMEGAGEARRRYGWSE